MIPVIQTPVPRQAPRGQHARIPFLCPPETVLAQAAEVASRQHLRLMAGPAGLYLTTVRKGVQ